MKIGTVLLACVICCGAPPTVAAQTLHKGWFVVVAAFPSQPEERQQRDAAKVAKMAAPCRVDPFNDLSVKFRTFAPDLNVFVLGAYARRGRAQAVADSVRRCFPGAYVKFGDHGGE
jgi:hypothetical protein